MSRHTLYALAALALVLPLRAQEGTPSPPDDAKPASPETNAPAIAPALVAVALTAGTGAMILSGMDWSDDESPDGVLGVPPASQPADGAVLPGPVAVFSWKAVQGAATYLLDIDLCSDVATCSDFRLDRTPDLSLSVELPGGAGIGRWRVRAVDADNIAGPWSAFRSFTVQAKSP
jgi:hypothetical protein